MHKMHKQSLRTGAVLLALAGLAGVASLAAPASSALASTHVPVLNGISATHHGRQDQLVFSFTGGLPRHWRVGYVPRSSGSGPSAAGRARLLVSFSHATGKDSNGAAAYGPLSRAFPLPGVIQVVTVADHRHTISFQVGLARGEQYRVVSLAHDRVAIDVRTPYRIVPVSEFFIDSNSPPGVAQTISAGRTVSRHTQVSDALQRLFAGPTPAELASGVRFVSSGATGFGQLSIRNGVARVHLKGGCVTGGSPVTIAAEIVPTLKQFPSVQWVKIYGPSGNTAQPDGHTDSIPACLQPTAVKVLTAHLRGPAIAVLVILAGPGILLGLVLTVLSMLATLAQRPNLITPADYRAERVKAHPVGVGQFEPDLAWPFYPLRQVRADLARIEAERRRRYARLWKWPGRPRLWVLLLPISALAVVCLLFAGLTTLLLTGLFALVSLVSAGVTAAVYGALALGFRGAEGAWHRVIRAEASCPHCYHVTPRPAYRCPGCPQLHRDLRPGRLGVFTRRCTCGKLLPTTALRAAWRLTAVCQRCDEPLRAGSGAVRDVRIPIFGATSAGKTRFLYAGLDGLIDITGRAHIRLDFPDENSKSQADMALAVIRSGQDTAKTSGKLPTALTCRVGKGRHTTLIHLFDTAGESYRGPDMQDALGFLDHGHGLVYVLDPLSIAPVRDLLAGQSAAAIGLANAATDDPETSYTEVVTRLRDSGVEAGDQRLAVVVSKADLLSTGGVELPDGSEAIAAWLTGKGMHNLVLSAGREFAEVQYFAVASLAATGASRRRDPAAPLRWLLAARGLRLPTDDTSPVPGGGDKGSDSSGDGEGAQQGETTKVDR
jgi:hypothetical protein